MKKLCILLLPIMLFSCTEKVQFVKLSDSSVTLFYNATKKLSANYSSDDLKSKTFYYTSSNPNVVSVTKLAGLVTAVAVGSATVTIASSDGKYTDQCDFIVSPKAKLYKDPFLVFGSSIATVKSNETRTLNFETISGLSYSDSVPDVESVVYLFQNDKLIAAEVIFSQTSNIVQVRTFLLERYKLSGVSSDNYYIYTDRKSNYRATLPVETTTGLYVLYLPPV
jgi:hypothetical protein